jgi:phage-related protein
MYIVLDGGKKGKNIFSHFSFETGAGISRGFFFYWMEASFCVIAATPKKIKRTTGMSQHV